MAKKSPLKATSVTESQPSQVKETPSPTFETKPDSKSDHVTHEEIALAAFLRWEKFGGDAETNWAVAEAELRGR